MRYQRDGYAAETLVARGQPVPEWVLNEPEAVEGDDFYLRAFRNLSTERQVGMSLGPIPHSKVREYGKTAGLDSDTLELFETAIRAMDEFYLSWIREQSSRGKEPKTTHSTKVKK